MRFKPDLWRPTGFLQCFDTVGLVTWPVKIVPEMTCYVSSGTLNPTHLLSCVLAYCLWSVTLSAYVNLCCVNCASCLLRQSIWWSMEATTLYDFHASNDGELSVPAGVVVKVDIMFLTFFSLVLPF